MGPRSPSHRCHVLQAYQIFKARAYGADAVLLIAAVLSNPDLEYLTKATRSLGMQCLIEVRVDAGSQVNRFAALQTKWFNLDRCCAPGQVLSSSLPANPADSPTPSPQVHDVPEMQRMLDLDLTGCMLGINNRDLRTFKVSLQNSADIMASVPGQEVGGGCVRRCLAKGEGRRRDGYLRTVPSIDRGAGSGHAATHVSHVVGRSIVRARMHPLLRPSSPWQQMPVAPLPPPPPPLSNTHNLPRSSAGASWWPASPASSRTRTCRRRGEPAAAPCSWASRSCGRATSPRRCAPCWGSEAPGQDSVNRRGRCHLSTAPSFVSGSARGSHSGGLRTALLCLVQETSCRRTWAWHGVYIHAGACQVYKGAEP